MEIVLIALMFPVLGILFGGIFSYPAIRLTKGRDPWLTLLLGVGLSITVFGIGYVSQMPQRHLVTVWLVSLLLLLLVRLAFGNLGSNFENFGMIHMLTLFILSGVLYYAAIQEKRLHTQSSRLLQKEQIKP